MITTNNKIIIIVKLFVFSEATVLPNFATLKNKNLIRSQVRITSKCNVAARRRAKSPLLDEKWSPFIPRKRQHTRFAAWC